MAGVELAGVTRRFGPTAAVDAVSLVVREREFLALLGPSGCGKTTLLRLIAGFERPDGGRITIGGQLVAGDGVMVPPERRRIGMVFQSYALWPHMTVRRNVGYALEVQGIGRAAYGERVDRALAAVGLSALAERTPAALSGGQRQRVALARCLVMQPGVVLLDEPLSNLDVHLRAALQAELADFHRTVAATTVYVTHDQAEALALADRVAVMDRGRLVQVAEPAALYRMPGTPMVAGFVGRGAVVPGVVLGVEGAVAVVELLGLRRRLRCQVGQATGRVAVCLRPEELVLAAQGAAATPGERRFQGDHVACQMQVGAVMLPLQLAPAAAAGLGAHVHIDIRDGWVIPDPD